MHVLFITSNYPSVKHPNRGTFVRQLVRTFAKKGITCSVICPISKVKNDEQKYIDSDDFIESNPIKVLYPTYRSYSNKKILNFNTFNFTIESFSKAVMKATKDLENKPDLVYGHFLYPSGYTAIKLGDKYNIPSFTAVGESKTTLINNIEEGIGLSKTIKVFKEITGIISVSQANTHYCVNKLNIPREKIVELPNAIDKSIFYPREKQQMRKELGLPLNKTLIVFTGQFINRKGPDRLLNAVEKLEDVGVVFIGQGPISLQSEKIVFKSVLSHEEVPKYLSASDMFVLPTLAEGSCNAIIEAMACKLPIISSDLEFNEGVLNSSNSIKIDPLNIEEISNAIYELHSNKKKRDQMSIKAYEDSMKYDINERALNIMKFLEEKTS